MYLLQCNKLVVVLVDLTYEEQRRIAAVHYLQRGILSVLNLKF